MLNGVEVNALEKRWKAWKTKSILKLSSAIFTVLLLLLASWLIFKYLPNFFSHEVKQEQIVKQNPKTIPKTTSEEDLYAYNDTQEEKNGNIETNTYPKEVVIDDEEYTPKPKKKNTYIKEEVLPEEDPSAELVDVDEGEIIYDEPPQPKETLIQIETQKPKISIESSNMQNYSSLKERFYETENIIFALMLAEEYYHNKDYKNALKWSVRANNLNSTNERSWIIFAKSLAKNGSTQKAINTLKAYLRTNPEANEIASLIEKIKLGDY